MGDLVKRIREGHRHSTVDAPVEPEEVEP